MSSQKTFENKVDLKQLKHQIKSDIKRIKKIKKDNKYTSIYTSTESLLFLIDSIINTEISEDFLIDDIEELEGQLQSIQIDSRINPDEKQVLLNATNRIKTFLEVTLECFEQLDENI